VCSADLLGVFLDGGMKVNVPDNQQVFEVLSPHTSQKPFADLLGFWSAGGPLQNFNRTHLCDSSEIGAILAVAVARQEAWGTAIRRCLPKLLCCSSVGRMRFNIKMKDLPRTLPDDEEGTTLSEERVDTSGESLAQTQLGAILEEGWPLVTVAWGAFEEDALFDCGLGNPDAEFVRFATDAPRLRSCSA